MSGLADASVLCLRFFDRLCSNLTRGNPDHLELMPLTAVKNEYGRFKVWCGNLGALATGHGSLDFRLRESAVMQTDVIKLLKQLQDALSESVAVVSDARLPYEQQSRPEELSGEDSSDAEEEDADRNERQSRKELQLRLSSITDILSNLYKLSFKIRNPKLRPRSLKASLYEEPDSETGVNLFSCYAKFDQLHVAELVRELRKATTHSQDNNEYNEYLTKHLGLALTERRRRFRYWGKHANKLATDALPVRAQAKTASEPGARDSAENKHKAGQRPMVWRDAPPSLASPTLPSGTEATTYDRKRDSMNDTESVVSYATTTRDLEGRAVDLPPPPQAAASVPDFVCPYCSVICPVRHGKGRAWRRSIREGLENHVANHLERIAAFALPRGLTRGAGDSDAGSNASQGRSANSQASEESGSLTFSDTGGPREPGLESESSILPQAISETNDPASPAEIQDKPDEAENMSQWALSNLPAFLLKSNAEIRKQFDEIEWRERLRKIEASSSPTTSRWVVEDDTEILQRNRYVNVQPFKHSRIHLKVPEGTSDYINASPITVKNSVTEETRYIATQGPMEPHRNHFWRMVWESTEGVAVIVMLTQPSEAGRDKDAVYYPLHMDEENFIVEVEDKDPFTDLATLTLKLMEKYNDDATHSRVRKLELTLEGEIKPVWHFRFMSWPDFGVPEDPERGGLLNLLKVSAERNLSPLNPLIVHCSAGVSRTGTFIALDHLLRELESTGFANVPKDSDPVFDTVNMLREQRMMMVQSPIQYQFIYQVLKDQLAARLDSSGHGSDLLVDSSTDPAGSGLNARSAKRAKMSS